MGMIVDNMVVSLFTREWIEIQQGLDKNGDLLESPSLRGSGLKSNISKRCLKQMIVSLFTREWIEITAVSEPMFISGMSPSLRGSGLKCTSCTGRHLFVRLPLYEGVDWNCFFLCRFFCRTMSPSLRGSGLKSEMMLPLILVLAVSLFTREWIEIIALLICPHAACVSLFTREWIEIDSLPV